MPFLLLRLYRSIGLTLVAVVLGSNTSEYGNFALINMGCDFYKQV